jgi:hypothetical protein
MCKTVCKTKEELMQHVETHTMRQNQMIVNEALETVDSSNILIKCELCYTTFRGLNSYQIHREKLYLKKAFICEFCGEEFHLLPKLTIHKHKMHSDAALHKVACTICLKMISKNSIQQHQKNHTKIKIGRYPCNICRKVFTEKHTLRQHAKTHMQFKAFSCNICDMKFNSNSHLQNHIRVIVFSEAYFEIYYIKLFVVFIVVFFLNRCTTTSENFHVTIVRKLLFNALIKIDI